MKTTDTHVYFVGGYLSNWHATEIDFRLTPISEPFKFNCSEQIYMAYKALVFNDFATLEAILQAGSPDIQKRFGRQVRNFNQNIWTQYAPDVMYEACLAKFTQHDKLRQKLIETNNRTIVEAAWYDNIWGVGLREDDPLILDEANWKGTNWLGKCLMQVREQLKNRLVI